MPSPARQGLKRPALDPRTVPARHGSAYPEPFRALAAGRSKQPLGDAVGLKAFGVNLVRLPPGAWSSVRHWHTREDEFVYVLEGELALVTNGGEQTLGPGMAAGFPAGAPDGHHLLNRGDKVAVYLEVGDRPPGDEVDYPDVDMRARQGATPYTFLHKDGTPY
ncbi:MAG: cupin domain-containing protein [Alphaproteobacteria bacterium]